MAYIISDAREPGFKFGSVHVLLNGNDVTNRCYRAEVNTETGNGLVFLFKTDDRGEKYFDPVLGDAAREKKAGKVQIIPA